MRDKIREIIRNTNMSADSRAGMLKYFEDITRFAIDEGYQPTLPDEDLVHAIRGLIRTVTPEHFEGTVFRNADDVEAVLIARLRESE